jgi:hypothetical protein
MIIFICSILCGATFLLYIWSLCKMSANADKQVEDIIRKERK